MQSYLDDNGNVVNPQYINPIESNISIGKLQTTLPNGGIQGNLTKNGQLDTSKFSQGNTQSSGMSGTDIAGGVASLAGMNVS